MFNATRDNISYLFFLFQPAKFPGNIAMAIIDLQVQGSPKDFLDIHNNSLLCFLLTPSIDTDNVKRES